MQAKTARHIKSGKEFDHLIPKPDGKDIVIESVATLKDTLKFLPKAVEMSLEDTRRLAPKLKGRNLRETCRNTWEFVYGHIAYRPDVFGIEQVRRPARSWAERKRGVDCDCYSVFISSILTNLGIAHSFRVTKYPKKNNPDPPYQHVYVIVPSGKGHITLDPVLDGFDQEELYLKKFDIPMELHYLSGFGGQTEVMTYDSHDDDLIDDLDGLGLFRRKRRRRNQNSGGQQTKKPGFLKRTLHTVNRVNPAVALLRVGILASMRLNLMKVAERMRFAYLSRAEAQKRGFRMDRFAKLQKALQRLEKIFYGAGGKPHNLKKAILTGKGNRDKQVSLRGLEGLGAADLMLNFGENSSLVEILGPDLYNAELVRPGMQMEMQGLGQLGEVATGAAIAAASAAVGAIAAILKNIGDVRGQAKRAFTKNQPASDSGGPAPMDFSSEGGNMPEPSFTDNGGDAARTSEPAPDEKPEKKGIGQWIKDNPGKAIAIGVGGSALIYLGYRAVTNNKKKKPGLNGLDGMKKRKRKTPARRKPGHKPAARKPSTRKKTSRKRTTQKRKSGIKTIQLS